MDGRECKIVINTGTQGGGKSNEQLRELYEKAYLVPVSERQKSLIFDTNMEFGAYKLDGKTPIKVQVLPHSNIEKYSASTGNKIMRIIPIHDNGEAMDEDEVEKLLIVMIKKFRNGILFIDDLNNIFGDSLPADFAKTLTSVRHRRSDLVMNLQSVGRILPKMYQNVKTIRFHKQLDLIESSSDKIGSGEMPIFRLAEIMVEDQFRKGNIRYFVYIYRLEGKIRGNFSPKMFIRAIQEYLSVEYDRLIKKELNKKDLLTGSPIYTSAKQVVDKKTAELYYKYYGN